MLTKSIKEAMVSRRSVRNFIDRPLDPKVRTAIESKCAVLAQSLAGQECRIVPVFRSMGGKIGSYGVIRNAQCWLVLVYRDSDVFSAVNAGMVMENMVLWLTSQGLGTCWVGGTFSLSYVSKYVAVRENDKIAAMVAAGEAAARDSLLSGIMKSAIGSRHRKKFEELFKTEVDSPFRPALEMMCLAPSSYNSQPWRGIESPAGVMNFYTSMNNSSGFLNLGIALSHFTYFAPKGTWRVVEGAPLYKGAVYALSWISG